MSTKASTEVSGKRKRSDQDEFSTVSDFIEVAKSEPAKKKKKKKSKKKKSQKGKEDDELQPLAKRTKAEKAAVKKFTRGKAMGVKGVKDKKARSFAKITNRKFKNAAISAARAEILLTEEAGFLQAEGMEKTYQYSQKAIREHVDIATTAKCLDLALDFGPYSLDFSQNGRWMLMGGKKGHVAVTDWARGDLSCEIQLRETVKDVKFLHNETMFAVAQKKYVYIYDKTGMELHCLRHLNDVNKLEFLPYHFLLCSIGNAGYLKYQDTSTGQLVAEHRTRLGQCSTMKANPRNAITHLGHSNGTVTLWSPNMSKFHVKMLCHKGPVMDLGFDTSGHYMVTSGADRQVAVWDTRTYKRVHGYQTGVPASTIDVSQKGLLSLGCGPRVQVWKNAISMKAKSPYMNHLIPSSGVKSVRFVPYEDFLGVGHLNGVQTLVIPGSGEPNYDTLVADPYQTKKQRQEIEVKSLLDKIQPDMITLDEHFAGTVERGTKEQIAAEKRLAFEANHPTEKWQPKYKKRGRSSAMKRYLKKQQNVVDKKRTDIRQKLNNMEKEAKKEKQIQDGTYVPPEKSVLDRFKR